MCVNKNEDFLINVAGFIAFLGLKISGEDIGVFLNSPLPH